jgi:urease accessory protein
MKMRRSLILLSLAALAALTDPMPALAHIGGHAGGFTNGLAHPFYGLDHVLAMVAVGLWASQLGRPALLLLPGTFPAVMIVGALIGWSGVPFPWLEFALAGSIIALGAVIAFGLRPALIASVGLVALFALFHGYEHGATLPAHGTPLLYGAGFVLATLILHAVGLTIGLLAMRPSLRYAINASGVAIAAIGVFFLVTA